MISLNFTEFMCGLSGVYAFTDTGRQAKGRLEQSMHALRHRGPDAEGLFSHGKVALAHRRLSVIAPSEEAAQPMQDPGGRFTIVYNGEVFNYRELRAKLQAHGYTFRTDSDTEVVLQLYLKEGQEFLKRLRGFFVLAIYDRQEESLFIARDRYGEKPLLYYKDADKFLFGSEMAALLELGVPRELDHTSLFQYLQLTYVPAPASMLRGVKKLLPGHFLHLKAGKLHQKMWYRLPYDAEKAAHNPLSYSQQHAKLEKLLEQAVVSRLTADVPVGAFLSGGIDSSIVTALASRQMPGIKTFSVGFEGQAFWDETHYARLVADRYKTDHTEYRLTTQDMYQSLEGMLNSLSEPFADSSALAVYMLSSRVSQQVKCVLSGDGADELFAGYNKHSAEYQLLSGGVKVEAVKRFAFLWNLLPASRNSFTANKVRQLRRFSEGAGMSHKDRYWRWASWATEAEAMDLLEPRLAVSAMNRLYLARKQRLLSCLEDRPYNLNNVLCADWQLLLANDMLPKIDLMGMAHGLEIRSPFLDHKIVKFAFSLPVSSKIDASLRKKVLQDTFRKLLPQELYNRPKQGFEIPLLNLLQGEARPLVNKFLADDLVREQGLFDPGQVRKLLLGIDRHNAGQWQTQVWSLLVFQHWWHRWLA